MAVEIINKPFIVTLHGYSGKVVNKNYGQAGMKLMDPMWAEVKSKGIKNKGINYWVYDKDDMLFCGVELEQELPADSKMEVKKINISKYAYIKHIGSYNKIKDAYDQMRAELAEKGIQYYHP